MKPLLPGTIILLTFPWLTRADLPAAEAMKYISDGPEPALDNRFLDQGKILQTAA